MAKKQNPLLKTANEEHEYTLEQIKELQQCSEDVVYFIKKYCKIQHPVRGSIPFELYKYQEKMLRTYQSNNQVIVLSARQTGKCFLGNTKIQIRKHPTNWFKSLILKLLKYNS